MAITEDVIVCPFQVVVDSREQAPYTFDAMPLSGRDRGKRLVVPIERKGLKSGDYSIVGMEERIAIERKSLQDLYSTLGQDRERFEAEFERLNQLEFAAIVIEADARDLWRPVAPAEHERKALETIHAVVAESQDMDAAAALEVIGAMLVKRWDAMPHQTWHSKLNPRSVEGTIVAWSLRFPRVHWWPMGSRRAAEVRTFGALEMFWRMKQKEEGNDQ